MVSEYLEKERYTCPCCGYRTLGTSWGGFSLCYVCYWEDDGIQLLDPAYAGGANKLSLAESQSNFAKFGACEEQFLDSVRPPRAEETRDPKWRPVTRVDFEHARLPRDVPDEDWDRPEKIYYWILRPGE